MVFWIFQILKLIPVVLDAILYIVESVILKIMLDNVIRIKFNFFHKRSIIVNVNSVIL